MKVQEYSAKTVDAAIEKGLSDLGVSSLDAKIEVLSEGGLLSKAKVRITVEDVPTVKETASAEEAANDFDQRGEKGRAFLAETLRHMGLDAEVVLNEGTEEISLEVKGEDTNALFTKQSEAVDALQYLTSLVANSGSEKYRRIVLDSAHYRTLRQEKLEKLADDMANKAIERGFRIKLEPMNPYERRIIHTRLAERTAEVSTHSEGEEPNRYLVITPVVMKAKSYEPKDEASSDYSSRAPRDGKYHPEHQSDSHYNNNRRRNDNRGGERKFERNGEQRNGGDRKFERNGEQRNGGERKFERNGEQRNGGERKFERNGEQRNGGDRNNRDRNSYGRDRKDGGFRRDRSDRPPLPPRAKSTFIGTIVTNPIKTEDDDSNN